MVVYIERLMRIGGLMVARTGERVTPLGGTLDTESVPRISLNMSMGNATLCASMPRSSVAILRALLVVTLVGLVVGCQQHSPPAVVVVSFDTLRADRLGSYGYTNRKLTPHMDALAREGILFETAIAASPWTTPSHVSLLTGQYPSSHGVMTPYSVLLSQLTHGGVAERIPDDVATLAEILRRDGYATAAFTGGITLDASVGFARGFDRYETNMFKVSNPAMDEMLGWVDAQRGRPFLLFWHTFEVHDPYHVTEFIRRVVSEGQAADVEHSLIGILEAVRRHRPVDMERVLHLNRLAAAHPGLQVALYDGGVLSADQRLAQLLDHLREVGRYDRALIVVTSDHGEELGERGADGIFGRHGHALFEECLRVPLILKLPGQRSSGRRVSRLARSVDVVPTLLDVLGVEHPAIRLDGESLRPLWEKEQAGERLAIAEALAFGEEKKCVRSARWKYIVSVSAPEVAQHGRSFLPASVPAELYDLGADPGERHNLIVPGEPKPGEAERFDAFLREYLAAARGPTSEMTQMAPEAVEGLRALGYVE